MACWRGSLDLSRPQRLTAREIHPRAWQWYRTCWSRCRYAWWDRLDNRPNTTARDHVSQCTHEQPNGQGSRYGIELVSLPFMNSCKVYSHAPLSRGDPLPKDLQRFDMLLAADCVYFEPAFPLLVDTLCQLADREDISPEIIFCYKKRRKADKRFFALLKKHFTWSDVTDDPKQEKYSRDAISLFRLARK